jgi:hypothetical protein
MKLADQAKRRWCVLLAICALGGSARADGFDITDWVLQLPTYYGPGWTLAFIVLLLVADYVINALVIGWPAKTWSGLTAAKLARDLVPYTLWAQVADRIGALGSVLVLAALDPLLSRHGEGYFVTPLFLSKIVLSAIAIGFVVWRFARTRWGLSRGRAWILSIAGGVLTNPLLWFIGLTWLSGKGTRA